MDLDEAQRVVGEALAPLCGPLHEEMFEASALAEQFFEEHDMIDSAYNPGRYHLTRCLAHRRLSTRSKDLGGWRLALRRGANSPLLLTREAMRLKLLRPLWNEEVPPPGNNRARMAYYTNHTGSLMEVGASDFLGLWSFAPEGELMIRIVRPVGPWKFGQVAKTDLDFYLPREPDDLESLTFTPWSDMDVELPFVAEEDGGDGTGSQFG